VRAHAEAPLAGSILLAGLFLRLATYGIHEYTRCLTVVAVNSVWRSSRGVPPCCRSS
jgi:NADH:ubiquinone oxidoreductase subunit 4 (subunit M)